MTTHATTCYIVSSLSTNLHRNKSTPTTRVPPTQNRFHVRFAIRDPDSRLAVICMLIPPPRITVVLSAIQDILLQLHLRDCGLL